MVSSSRLVVAAVIAVIAAIAVIDRHIDVSLGIGVNAQIGNIQGFHAPAIWAARQFGRAPRDEPVVHFKPPVYHAPQIDEAKRDNNKAARQKPETPKWTYTPPPNPTLEMPTELLAAIAATETSSTETDAASSESDTCPWVEHEEI